MIKHLILLKTAELAGELYKPITRKFEKLEVCSSFKDNIWGADLVDMQLISRYDLGFRCLLRVIDITSVNIHGFLL